MRRQIAASRLDLRFQSFKLIAPSVYTAPDILVVRGGCVVRLVDLAFQASNWLSSPRAATAIDGAPASVAALTAIFMSVLLLIVAPLERISEALDGSGSFLTPCPA
jgi:hypothetical protein